MLMHSVCYVLFAFVQCFELQGMQLKNLHSSYCYDIDNSLFLNTTAIIRFNLTGFDDLRLNIKEKSEVRFSDYWQEISKAW